MNPPLRFCFELDSLADAPAWGQPPDQYLHWYGLTSGQYWLETGAGTLFEFTNEARSFHNQNARYVDYYLARWMDDLQEILAPAWEPVPGDIARLIEDPARLEAILARGGDSEHPAAAEWWFDRQVDTGYLRCGPRISVWRTGDSVHLRWRSRPNLDSGFDVFRYPSGQCEVSAMEFRIETERFCEDVLAAMRGRVQAIARDRWLRTDCRVSVTQLAAEQTDRERLFRVACERVSSTNWDEVRRHLPAHPFIR